MKLSSRFAVLDVLTGRKKLRRMVENEHHKARLPVVIHGFIETGKAWSNDDGESQEFAVTVDKIETRPVETWSDKLKTWVRDIAQQA